MTSSRPWVKVWESWWTSRSHADLSLTTLGIGLRIMSLTAAAPEQDGPERMCLRADGKPLGVPALARECRCTLKQLKTALCELVAVGTMIRGPNGGIGFRSWDEYQLSPSALRMRKHRHTERHSDAHSDVTPSVTLPARGQRVEGRTQEHPPNPPAGGKPTRRPLGSEIEDDLPDGLVDEVLDLLRTAVRDITRGRDRGPLDVPGNRDLIRKCTRREKATIEHWRTVIAAQAASVRHDPDAWRYLALSTLTRRTNWLRLLDAPVGRSPPRGPIDPSQMDYDSESPF